MKHNNPDSHLTYDELLIAMTDVSDLGQEQQGHLQACLHCQRQSEALAHRFNRLGNIAKKMAPKPSQPFRVPTRHATIWRWQFRPGVALGVLGVLIFAFTLWWPKPSDYSEQPAPMASYNMEEEAQLMAEVDALVKDALPIVYQKVAVVSEPILSKDLIDWIVPSIDEEDENIDPRA